MHTVFVHEPLTPSGWEAIEQNLTAETAQNLARAWRAKGWRVAICADGTDPADIPAPQA